MPDEAPYRNFNFVVDIEGVEHGFSEVVLPEAAIEAVEYREGTDKTTASRKLPGRLRLGNVVLRRGVTKDLALWEWFKAVRDGNLDRRTVSITLLDAERTPVRIWRLRGAWPCKYEGPELDARGNDIVIETLELTCEGIELED
jgi:phage tail-like protein